MLNICIYSQHQSRRIGEKRVACCVMGNSLRCCLACVLPCGALDLIRIVHIDGQVDEYGRPVSVKEILDANPNHVISKPCAQSASHRILMVSPHAELKRGNIYFLIPASSLPAKKMRKSQKRRTVQKKKTTDEDLDVMAAAAAALGVEEERRGHPRRKSGKVAVWRPHLESIYEDQL